MSEPLLSPLVTPPHNQNLPLESVQAAPTALPEGTLVLDATPCVPNTAGGAAASEPLSHDHVLVEAVYFHKSLSRALRSRLRQ